MQDKDCIEKQHKAMILIDDPCSIDESYDNAKRAASIAWFEETFRDRLNTDAKPVIVISKIYEDKSNEHL
jgi:hypothetical protein